jgi:hypothetical protein
VNDPISPDVVETAVQAAKDSGACCPDCIAEILRPSLYIEQTQAGPTVMCNLQGRAIPVPAAIAELRQNPTIKGLFERGAGLDLRKLATLHYRAIREKNPELIGLRPKR